MTGKQAEVLEKLTTHGTELEKGLCSPGLGRVLDAAKWAIRGRSARGRTTLTITDSGRAALVHYKAHIQKVRESQASIAVSRMLISKHKIF